MAELLPFFVVLFAGLFFSELFSRLHLPWVIALIVAGIAVGPHGFELLEVNPTIEFLGQIGLVFLMFMAGLETRFSSFRELKGDVSRIALVNGGIPFAVGAGLGFYFGYGAAASVLLGIIFISSSIAVVVPSLAANGLSGTRLGRSIISSTILEDVASLILLSVFLQTINPVARVPLPLFYALLFIFLFVLRWLIPKIRWIFFYRAQGMKDLFEKELRVVFLILIGVVVVFELLGLHPIIAGFFAGLALADSIRSDILRQKLRAISYGIFIPVFFVVVGAETNMSVFGETAGATVLVFSVAAASVLSKFLSGILGGRLAGFGYSESAVLGAATIPQLSTTLAVVFAGFRLGLLPAELLTAMLFLSVATTFLGPLLVSRFVKRLKLPQVVESRG